MTAPQLPSLDDVVPRLPLPPEVPDSADRRLLARLQQGEERAFEELVRANTHRLLAVARRLLRNEEDAQEVVQDGMILALRALPSFRGDCLLSTWLHRIVVNSALMRLRSRKRRPETSIEEMLPTFLSDGHQASPAPEWTDVERALEVQETRSHVRAAIDRLPAAYRTVLLLRDIEELDTPTVAGLLGASPNAVKIRVHRARQALARLLTPVFAAE
ncbi:MAG: sigma-70 family RNA polymerase sigma factor [Vicinamibacterales bacterium]